MRLAICTAAVRAAIETATDIGVTVSVAAVDAGGNLVAFARMDGAEIAGPALATDKAYTAVANRIATHELAVQAAPGGPLYGLHTTAAGRFVIFGGGVPVWRNGEIVGAVGVSGAAVTEDQSCAEAGAAAAEQAMSS